MGKGSDCARIFVVCRVTRDVQPGFRGRLGGKMLMMDVADVGDERVLRASFRVSVRKGAAARQQDERDQEAGAGGAGTLVKAGAGHGDKMTNE